MGSAPLGVIPILRQDKLVQMSRGRDGAAAFRDDEIELHRTVNYNFLSLPPVPFVARTFLIWIPLNDFHDGKRYPSVHGMVGGEFHRCMSSIAWRQRVHVECSGGTL